MPFSKHMCHLFFCDNEFTTVMVILEFQKERKKERKKKRKKTKFHLVEDLQMISHVICFNMVPWVQKRRKGYKDIRG